MKTIDHLTQASEGGNSHDEADAAHSDNVSISSDGCQSHDSRDTCQVARLYEEFKRLEGGGRENFGEISGGGEDVWLPLYGCEEGSVDEGRLKGESFPAGAAEHQKKVGGSREAESAMMLHEGRRWNKGELREWMVKKRKYKRTAQDGVLSGMEASRGSKKDQDRKKVCVCAKGTCS